ncbi:hypothetical protein CDD83_1666 [Cordyceps sp. RAO-2017]|nr:hypothetical protein CDD83_1666 [Cordyceps sp. RAO-2017]
MRTRPLSPPPLSLSPPRSFASSGSSGPSWPPNTERAALDRLARPRSRRLTTENSAQARRPGRSCSTANGWIRQAGPRWMAAAPDDPICWSGQKRHDVPRPRRGQSAGRVIFCRRAALRTSVPTVAVASDAERCNRKASLSPSTGAIDRGETG